MKTKNLLLIFILSLFFSTTLFAQETQNPDGAIWQQSQSDEFQNTISAPFVWKSQEQETFNAILSSPRFNSDLTQTGFTIGNIAQLRLLKDLLDILPSDRILKNSTKIGIGTVYCCDREQPVDACIFTNPVNNHRIENKLSVNYMINGGMLSGFPGGTWPTPIFDTNLYDICSRATTPVFYVNPDKQFGFGTNQPQAMYHFAIPQFQFGDDTKLKLKLDNETNNESLKLSKAGYDLFKVNKDGKVFAREFEVTLASSFPDYVFSPDYQLIPINDLNHFIKTEKHLPGIPAASEVQKKGTVNVGELQLKMLEKIEELTLYIIQQQQQIESLQQQINAK
ncbi:MAG: hypothetical protein V4651_09370 [Bacteroidota bacterium]